MYFFKKQVLQLEQLIFMESCRTFMMLSVGKAEFLNHGNFKMCEIQFPEFSTQHGWLGF